MTVFSVTEKLDEEFSICLFPDYHQANLMLDISCFLDGDVIQLDQHKSMAPTGAQ